MSVPVVIVSGFLGSGKTTVLNHLLHNRQQARIGAVVNDFGSVNVDAMLVSGQVDAMVTLSNGCLCCAVDASGLDAMVDRLADPDLVDLIVIEASGLADPRDLIRLMVGSRHPNIAYQGLVEVVDACEYAGLRQRHPELDEHVKAADLIVLNKIDRVEDPDTVAATLRDVAAGAPVLPVEYGRVDPQMLFDPPRRVEQSSGQLSFADLVDGDEHDEHHAHLHAQYQAVDLSTETPLDPRALTAFLIDQPAGTYRIKGVVHFAVPGHQQKFTLHTVGSFVRFERSHWSPDEQPRTDLVLIGAGIDTDDAAERLRQCEHHGDCAIDEQAMVEILKFL